MASTRTHQSMGFLKEGGTAANHLPARHVPLKPEKIHKGGSVQSSREFCDEMDFSGRCATTKTKEAIMKMSEKHSNSLNAQSENMPPDSICKGVKVTLDNNSMWNEYFRCRTEMILTKQGCRMFPYCRFRISGLQPHRKYSLIMDIQPLDNNQYIWTGEGWQTSRKAECHIKSKPFIHPESPATGQHWMQSPVSFYKLKLTNNLSYQEENIILHPLHRYLPRLHLVEMDKATDIIRLNDPNVLTFSFRQTEFITVTTYQNPQFAQLKVNYNPFAKGLKEGGLNSWGLKLKANIGKDVNKDGSDSVSEQHPVKKSLKILLENHKPKCSKEGVSRFSIDHQKNSTKNNDPCSAAVPKETPSSTEGKKLGVGERDSTSPSTPRKQSPTGERHRKLKDGKHHLNMEPNCCSAAPSEVGQVSSEYSDHQHVSAAASDTVKQQKRPARLPLPALALFLKQHSTKYKKTNGKMTSPTQAPPTESPPKSKDAIAAPHLEAIVRNTTECSSAHPDQIDLDGTEQAGEAAEQSSSQLSHNSIMASYSVDTKTDDPLAFAPEGLGSELKVPDDKPVTTNFHDSFSPPSLSTCSTSFPVSHSLPHTVLSAPNSPKTAVESSDPLKSEPLLFYSECSFDFGPLSLASSPEPLPSLPACLGLDTESSSAAAATNESVKDPEHSKSTSVLKWHTVLPPPETNVQSLFTFHSPHQVSPLMSVTPPLFPRHLQPPSLNSTPTSPNGSTQSFQETEPPLPFPGELSPLTLQLSLSPTFSSLDENGLSPTPSLSDLVHLFTTDVDIGMGVEFANTEPTSAPCPSPTVAEIQEASSQMLQVPVGKPCTKKKASKSTKLARLDMDQSLDDYRSKQPNLDEVEEQLFISFTSKVNLEKLLSGDVRTHNTNCVKETIAAFQKNLLKDLDLMKYRQVIHPVLQEVGLKMTLLDPALSIDLQYLGVCLPIPPPGTDVETGKTTDVTQIKGWREKFTSSMTLPISESGVPSSEPQKKNLSAFCSDMLDEYLENEGKLIDERAASFSQPPVETPVYKLPKISSSYVRTLDHIQTNKTTLKHITSSHILSHSGSIAVVSDMHRDLAPVESDSELEQTSGPSVNAGKRESQPTVTRALLRQKELENGVVWEGCDPTSITKERAAIALTSLFTQTGFVSEDPTAPVQLPQKRALPCQNDFCRLGCVCSSLSYNPRISHCGRPPCMFGCSCLKQKVVLLKNLDSSDSSTPSHHDKAKKRKKKKKKKKKRRMKMAYVLKEADSVTQSVKRVRTLWRRNVEDTDPEPTYNPIIALPSSSPDKPTCSRKHQFILPVVFSVVFSNSGLCLMEVFLSSSATKKAQQDQGSLVKSTQNPPAERTPKPARRLFIMADCKWDCNEDRSLVLKKLCRLMAREQLDKWFWFKKYLISPINKTLVKTGFRPYIQYTVQVSAPSLKKKQDAVPEKEATKGNQKNVKSSTLHEQVSRNLSLMSDMTAMIITGTLLVDKMHPWEFFICLQVNGKLYPLANIHVDGMGASHPANHLVTFLTGHVGSQSQSYVSSKAPNSGPAPITALSASSDPAASTPTITTTSTPPSVTQHTFTTSPTGEQADSPLHFVCLKTTYSFKISTNVTNSSSLSSNGSNQQSDVLMVPAPVELSAQTFSVLGKVTELRHAPQSQAANIKSVSDTSNWGVKSGPAVECTNGGVLAPPPLLHMKAESGVGNGGVTWRPMPRLVPLGLRGNSPS
uniref:T-box domain-containing protein n=1 Tax=Nothobranchius furzeri TaxID=105023 RepID=A0A8C6L288_NOTFU